MKRRIALLIPIILFLLISSANAGIWGESVGFNDLNDQRTFSSSTNDPPLSEGELDGYWPYSFTIKWNITKNADTMFWNYEYTLSATRKELSHFILEVTNPFIEEESFISDVMINGNTGNFEGPREWNGQGNSNPELPIDSLFGIKFEGDGHSSTYKFTTNLDPVWGNFYAKSGKEGDHWGRRSGKEGDHWGRRSGKEGDHWGRRRGKEGDHWGRRRGKEGDHWVYAYNTALGIKDFNSDNKLDFIVRPDGGKSLTVVPEPISSILFVTGGSVLAVRRYWKAKRRKHLNLA